MPISNASLHGQSPLNPRCDSGRQTISAANRIAHGNSRRVDPDQSIGSKHRSGREPLLTTTHSAPRFLNSDMAETRSSPVTSSRPTVRASSSRLGLTTNGRCERALSNSAPRISSTVFTEVCSSIRRKKSDGAPSGSDPVSTTTLALRTSSTKASKNAANSSSETGREFSTSSVVMLLPGASNRFVLLGDSFDGMNNRQRQ